MTDTSNYLTHIPILSRLVDMTSGPILELGIGFSTVLLHAMAKQSGREVYSYENDREWHKKYFEFNTYNHHVFYIDNWDDIKVNDKHWSVALIDHRPAMRRRVDAVRLARHADYIILHDSEPEIDRFYRYSSIYKHFKYRYDYKKCLPNTTVLSNFKDLSSL